MSSLRDAIEYAKRHGGIITRHEAAALGVTTSTLQRRIDDGVFVRVASGVFALPGAATRPDLSMRAACRHLGAIVSHESAGVIHGFEPIDENVASVTVSHRGTNRFPGVVVHQSTDLRPEHIETIGQWTLTNPTRTLIDLAQVLKRGRLERVVDNALAGSKVEIDTLIDLFDSLARKGKKGTKAMRDILDRRVDGPQISATELEHLLLGVIRRAGLPEPNREFSAPWLKQIEGRVDLAYPDARIVIEADSRRWHTMFDAFEVDRRRDNAAQLAGWVVLRFTWRMVVDRPSEVVSTIRIALESRRSGADSSFSR